MSKKLIIIMANTDPKNCEELGAPIFQASVAAAMGYEAEVICTAVSAQLMKKGRRGRAAPEDRARRSRSTISSRKRTPPASSSTAARRGSISSTCIRKT